MVDRQKIIDLLRKHEGFRATAYRDSTGHLTVGIGFNLDAPGAEAMCQAAGLDYLTIRGGQAITEDQADALLGSGIDHARFVATILVKDFQELPDNVQLVVIDMIFNLGSDGFLQFRNTIAAIEKRDWSAAAAGMRNSAWHAQVGARADEDIGLILACGN